MALIDALKPQWVKVPLVSVEKRAAIEELIDLLAERGQVRDPAAAKRAVWQRELSRTTGIGKGVAIPHGKTPGVDRLAMAIGKPAKPMNFDSADGKPVSVIFLMVSPPDMTGPHIQAMARVARLMDGTEFREALLQAPDAPSLYQLIEMVETSDAFAKSMGVTMR